MKIFLLDKGWSHTKRDAIIAFLYIYLKFKNAPKTKLLRDGVRWREYCNLTKIKDFCQREQVWTINNVDASGGGGGGKRGSTRRRAYSYDRENPDPIGRRGGGGL